MQPANLFPADGSSSTHSNQGEREVERMLELKGRQNYSERLSAVSHFTSSLASELNNTLTPIVCYSQLLLQADLPEHYKSWLSRILEASDRATEIIRGMLDFSSNQVLFPEKVDLYQTVRESLSMARDLFGLDEKQVSLKSFRPDPMVSGDRGQLVHAILHLVRNAIDSTQPERRRIKVRIKGDLRENPILEIKDNGKGIPQKNLTKILLPFFTTHEEGHAGLGLSIVNGIVESHKAQLDFETAYGKGTLVRISFPEKLG
ncbi:MAG: HAMP domain-containing histidine kinase [Candidatus Omnitrophica bacterium]|nr:HAMP domain-containing histidine kinase [Candidatus Omnitrophota bacterium]MCA9442581.1 HAMP domain-containing histidine kinase [Candidatus Omnitrophota bacterium]MCA9447601.1 HAMP domain-containing histidine kinase [Candidatus Omnitrophota bacterium]